jgi:hypothetical protein
VTTLGFGIGSSFIFLLDHFAPHIRFGEKEIPGYPKETSLSFREHLHSGRHRLGWRRRQNQIPDLKLVNTGLLLAIGIPLHNLPEGIAVGAGYLHNPNLAYLLLWRFFCIISRSELQLHCRFVKAACAVGMPLVLHFSRVWLNRLVLYSPVCFL